MMCRGAMSQRPNPRIRFRHSQKKVPKADGNAKNRIDRSKTKLLRARTVHPVEHVQTRRATNKPSSIRLDPVHGN